LAAVFAMTAAHASSQEIFFKDIGTMDEFWRRKISRKAGFWLTDHALPKSL
jgi:hypothetical protein